MNYHEDRPNFTIELLMFCEFLDALPEGMKEEVWNDHFLDKHQKTTEEKISEGMNICNNPDQDAAALCHDVKSYMVIIKHYKQPNKSRVQDISLCSAGGRSKGDSSEILMICSMRFSPLHARLATAYKAKN